MTNFSSPIADAFAAKPEITTSTDGCEIAYWEGGNPNGPSIIFLHGFALDHSVWAAQFSDLQLSGACRLVAIDMRGHGDSGHPADETCYTDGRLWADDLQAVITACGLRRPVVVAWSYGGRMINDFLRYFGQSTLAGINYVAAATLAWQEAIGPAHVLLNDLCSSREPEEKTARKFVEEIFDERSGTLAFEHFMQVIRQTTPLERARLRIRPLDYDHVLATLELPVLVSHGCKDQVVLPCLAQRLKEVLGNARVSIYPDAGHAPFLDEASRFNRELNEFAIEAHRTR